MVHTNELGEGNRTTDAEIIRIADRDERVVVTKDHDFLDGHLLNNAPQRLLLVTTGNIRNDDSASSPWWSDLPDRRILFHCSPNPDSGECSWPMGHRVSSGCVHVGSSGLRAMTNWWSLRNR